MIPTLGLTLKLKTSLYFEAKYIQFHSSRFEKNASKKESLWRVKDPMFQKSIFSTNPIWFLCQSLWLSIWISDLYHLHTFPFQCLLSFILYLIFSSDCLCVFNFYLSSCVSYFLSVSSSVFSFQSYVTPSPVFSRTFEEVSLSIFLLFLSFFSVYLVAIFSQAGTENPFWKLVAVWKTTN